MLNNPLKIQSKVLFLALSVSACIAAPTPGTKTEMIGGAIGATVGVGVGMVKGTGFFVANAFDRHGYSHGDAFKGVLVETGAGAITGGVTGAYLAEKAKRKVKGKLRSLNRNRHG